MTGLQVACAADEAYVPHAAAMLHSLLARHAPREITVHFLHAPELGAAWLGPLRAMVRGAGAAFEAHAVPEADVADLPVMPRIPRTMWYRLFLPQRLAGLPRVLYLDCDTVVVDDPMSLWRTDLGPHPLGAVENVFEPGREHHAAALGLSRYFNSGVLLMDLEAWRAGRLDEQVLARARAPGPLLTWPDQDALNTVLAQQWLGLHPRWNCQNSFFHFRRARAVLGARALAEARRAPGILHFEGGLMAKPWHYLCRHPHRDLYFKHRRETPWPDVSLEGRTAFNRLIRPLPLPLAVRAIRLRGRLGALRRRLLGRRWPERSLGTSQPPDAPVPAAMRGQLRPDHPRLLDLQRRYRDAALPMLERTWWTPDYVARSLDLVHFRGDNAYLWQTRHMPDAPQRWHAYACDVAARDGLGLFGRLNEDGAFGAFVFRSARFPALSRDLLDSINELNFLERHARISGAPLAVLDIGAGYGRLAHRSHEALPRLERYFCTDAIAESTFLCEQYLDYRNCARARVVPVDELGLLRGQHIDLAVNVHSFSEMSLGAIEGWLDLLDGLRVPRLFVVPNDGAEFLSMEAGGTRRDFRGAIERRGFRLAAQEFAIADGTARQRIGVFDQLFLFARGA